MAQTYNSQQWKAWFDFDPAFQTQTTQNKELNGLRAIVGDMKLDFNRQIYGANEENKVETAQELRKKLKEAEKRERAYRKAERRVARVNKARDERRQTALDSLVRIAAGGNDTAAVEAAKTLLQAG